MVTWLLKESQNYSGTSTLQLSDGDTGKGNNLLVQMVVFCVMGNNELIISKSHLMLDYNGMSLLYYFLGWSVENRFVSENSKQCSIKLNNYGPTLTAPVLGGSCSSVNGLAIASTASAELDINSKT